LRKNKKDCADIYCVTLIELEAHHDAFIQNTFCVLRWCITCAFSWTAGLW